MANLNHFAGIDVSKEFFDAHFIFQGQPFSGKFSNDAKGFAELMKKLSVDNHCVMEATGPYYLPLACFLHKNSFKVSVVNPLVIKRYSQMMLIRAKTDKADARMIAGYAAQAELNLWEPPQQYLMQLQQLDAVTELLTTQRTKVSNQLHAFVATGVMNKALGTFLKKELHHIDQQLEELEQRMYAIVKEYHGELMKNITSIPGIGKKTAMSLIIVTGGFKKFSNHKQLSSYIGICPRIYTSGTSVKGKGKICKMGMSRIRAMLFMCTMSAKKANSSCRELFERLVAKGKPKMLALIAVANKLLRQAFAIGTRQVNYQPDYSRLNKILIQP